MNVGDKVVCLKKGNWTIEEGLRMEEYRMEGPQPQSSKVYVISKILWYPSWGTLTGLCFVGGITCFCRGFEVGYDSRFFRKLEDVQNENRMFKESGIDDCFNL